MISRRQALKQVLLTTGAVAMVPTIKGETPPSAPAPEEVFKLPPLAYDYDALEPHIDTETMKIHHDKHHAAYVAKLNQAIVKAPGLEKQSIEEILSNLDAVPEGIRKDVRNQGGGHANHSLFWKTLKKNENGKPAGELAKEITSAFGSYDDFWKLYSEAAAKVFGSGWAWLVWRGKKLAVESSSNQDSPLSSGGQPLLGLDVWEHAYYLKYQNRRAEYIKAFQIVFNWEYVSEQFNKLT